MAVAGAAEGGAQLELNYRVDFDLDAMGDKLCGLTKFCDCSSVYVGRGTLVEKTKDRWTFEGTWEITQNSCKDPLQVWLPADGKAFHSFKVVDGKMVEWVVHGDKSNHIARKEGIKEHGQFWMNELAVTWPTKRFETTQQDNGDMGMGITLTGKHLLIGAITE